MGEIALHEVKRCLKCKNARCMQACPASTPLREAFELLQAGKVEDAGKLLFDNNPLTLICSYVCPHELQCEGACVLNAKGVPIHISAIEQYISNCYMDMMTPEPINIDHNKKVAIIGTGPAGLTIAITLVKRGYDITMFEVHDHIGGVLHYGIPEFRLPKEVLSRLKRKMLAMGIKLRPNIMVGTTITVDDLFNDGYKAVFIGTGLWKPQNLKIKGETFGHVHYAIDYLKNPEACPLGKRVVVLGAGNVAVDAARTAIRHNVRDVTILYRGGEDNMSALKSEIEYAKFDGIKFRLYTMPLEITETGIRTIQTRFNEDGNLEMVEGTEEELSCDSVIVAIGQGARSLIVNSSRGIDIDCKGLIRTDQFGQTSRQGVFSSGDVVTGAKTVVQAMVHSKQTADAIDAYVTNLLEKANIKQS